VIIERKKEKKRVKFKNKAKNVGADLFKQVAKATNIAAGDGNEQCIIE
jgi:hypothetical protein